MAASGTQQASGAFAATLGRWSRDVASPWLIGCASCASLWWRAGRQSLYGRGSTTATQADEPKAFKEACAPLQQRTPQGDSTWKTARLELEGRANFRKSTTSLYLTATTMIALNQATNGLHKCVPAYSHRQSREAYPTSGDVCGATGVLLCATHCGSQQSLDFYAVGGPGSKPCTWPLQRLQAHAHALIELRALYVCVCKCVCVFD